MAADMKGIPPLAEIAGNFLSNRSLGIMISAPEPSMLMVCSALLATISNLGNPPSGVGMDVVVAVGAGLDVAARVGVDGTSVAVDARVCAGAQDMRKRARTIGSSLIVLILISILWWFNF